MFPFYIRVGAHWCAELREGVQECRLKGWLFHSQHIISTVFQPLSLSDTGKEMESESGTNLFQKMPRKLCI